MAIGKKSYLDSVDPGSITDDVENKKALPELILKANILQAEDQMLLKERDMMNNYRLFKKFDRHSVSEFEGSIILLFGFIKQMIIDKGYKGDEVVFKKMIALEHGASFKNPVMLLELKDFLLKYLHIINITNLFQSKGKAWRDELSEEY